ncbi:MAG: murein biosynthesis integral membrane protein MurJ [Bacillota bacterium]
MKKTALILMIITLLSKLVGFIRDITLSYFYGASDISDAYLISITIPTVIFALIGTGISTGYIPIFSKIEKNEGIEASNSYTTNLVNIFIIICTVIVILGLIFTDQIVRVFASGFEGNTLNLAVRFTRLSFFGIYFTLLTHIFNGFLQVKGNYVVPALVGFPMNIFIILAIFISFKSNVIFLPIGMLLGLIFQWVLIIPFVKKNGYKYNGVIDVRDKHFINMLYLSLPVIVGVSVNQINILVDRTIASQIVIGGISALNYANRLNGFILGIFVSSISTVFYPQISKKVAENNIAELKELLSESVNLINLMVIPSTVGAMMFAEPIIILLFGRGAFDSNAISITTDALFFYSIGMFGFGLREIFARTFYAMEDTKTPMVNAIIAMLLNIILNIVLSKYLGIGGLALATSSSAIFCSGLLLLALRKKIGSFGMKQISFSFLKILFTSFIMGTIAKLSFNYLTANIFSQNVSLLMAIGIGAISYFVIIYFMKIDDVDIIVNTLKRKLWNSAEE